MRPPLIKPSVPTSPQRAPHPSHALRINPRSLNRWQDFGGLLFFIGMIIIWATFIIPLVDSSLIIDHQIWLAGMVFIIGGIVAFFSGLGLKKRYFGSRYRFYLDRGTKHYSKLMSLFISLTVVAYFSANLLIPYIGTESPLSLPPPPNAPLVPSNTGISPSPLPSHPSNQAIPLGYYAKASEIYDSPPTHDIQALYSILMSDACKMPDYKFDAFDCSNASARLEWVLEGHGFRTRLYMSDFPPHMWVMAELDGGSWIAIESTLLTSSNYFPPGIIEGPNGEYREYSYLYQIYRDYIGGLDPEIYLLPKSYDDFLRNYLEKPIFNPLADLNYYSGDEFYDYLGDAVKGTGFFYYPITEFDWWNVSPYNSMEPFNEWD